MYRIYWVITSFSQYKCKILQEILIKQMGDVGQKAKQNIFTKEEGNKTEVYKSRKAAMQNK